MRIWIDGADPSSRSGPNGFARKLSSALTDRGHAVTFVRGDAASSDARIVFIQGEHSETPTALRLDGIYFNTRQDWERQNAPIRRSYDAADLIIHQTDFDKRLIESYFGEHRAATVIRNAGEPNQTMEVPPLVHPALDSFAQTWVSASSWRPHKRLSENIRYFREFSGERDCLVVAGSVNEDLSGVSLDRVLFAGDLDQRTLTSLYRRSSRLIHLAWLDHCPNVVVDARAAGCRIVCASSGGTEEVAGPDAIVVQEEEWDLLPIDLYSPPRLDFTRIRQGSHDHKNCMSDVAAQYEKALLEIAR